MGCAGNTEVSTPNIDAIAAEGAMFRNAYSNCPVCVPVRGTLLTGLHPLRHGAAGNDLPIRTDLRSVADELNDAGYDTAYIGKWHLGGVPRDQFITEDRRLGFRYWRANNCNHDYMNYFYDDNDNKHTEKKKVQGVYVLYGSEVQFKQISILYAEDDYVICDAAPDKDELFNGETVSLYDKVILKGDDLYDGKVIE